MSRNIFLISAALVSAPLPSEGIAQTNNVKTFIDEDAMTDKKSIRLSVTDITKKNAIQLVRDTSSKKITAYFLTSDFLGAHPNIRFMWLRFDDDEPIKLFAGYYIEGQVMLPTEMQAALLSKLPTVKRIRVRTTRYDQVIVDSEFKITDLYGQAAMFKKDCGLLS